MTDAIEALEHIDMKKYEPKRPPTKLDSQGSVIQMDEYEKLMLQLQMKEYMEKIKRYKNNCDKAYGLILGQCTQAVKNKLEERKDWKDIKADHDPLKLLETIKQITQDYQDNKYPVVSAVRSLLALFTIRQNENEHFTEYLKRFKNTQDVMENQFGIMTIHQYIPRLKGYDALKHEEYEKVLKPILKPFTLIVIYRSRQELGI